MGFINCGAFDSKGQRFPSKKALKAALLEDPASVEFDKTAITESGSIKGDEIPEGVKLSVVLPCPYTNRRFYATVENKDGKPVMK